MIIRNPTKSRLEVQIYGVAYSVEPESSVSGVPASAAEYWKKRLHNFLTIESESEVEEKERRIEELNLEIEKAEKVVEDKEIGKVEETIEEENPTEETKEEEAEEEKADKPKTNKKKNE